MGTLLNTRLDCRRTTLAELFGLDVRSLAAFRIGAALTILIDLWYRGQEITAYFTDHGVLPRPERVYLFAMIPQEDYEHIWSLHMLAGTYWSQLLLMLVAAWFAIWLLLGYRTRLAALASWLLLASLDSRNPLILNSGDVLFRSMLLWSLFLPLGAAFSLDRRYGRAVEVPQRILSAATLGIILQLCMMYWFSALFKSKSLEWMESPWTHDYSAIYYALNLDAYTAPLGIWLRQFPTVMKGLTIGSFWLEIVGPILLFSPIWTRRIRVVVVVAFCLFHLGLAMTLTIGIFPLICIVCWLLLVPGEFWAQVAAAASRCSSVLDRYSRGCAAWIALQLRAKCFANPETPRWRRRWAVESLLMALVVYTLLWNIRELDVKYWEPRILPLSWNAPARILGLDQNWSMFAPLPRTEDGWLVMKGTLQDGTVVNLWEFDEPLPLTKPPLVSATYHTQRWRKYLDNLTTDHFRMQREYFCDWLAWRWNQERAGDDPQRQVHTVELMQWLEITPPPGQPFDEPVEVSLCVRRY